MRQGPGQFTAPRTSTILGQLKDDYFLKKRDLRYAAVGVARNEPIARMVRHLDPDAPSSSEDRRKLDDAVSDAMKAAGVFDKAHTGSADHSVIEYIGGDTPPFLDKQERDLKATVEWTLTCAGFRIVEAERPIWNSIIGCSGRFDLVLEHGQTGQQYVTDLKTGGVWPAENAMQIATYAHADLVWRGDPHGWGVNGNQQYVLPKVDTNGWGPHAPTLSTEVGIVLHVPQNTTEPVALVMLDLITPWEWVQLARTVYDTRRAMRQYEAAERVEYPRLMGVTS